jgi:hypothetical protein
MDEEVDQMVAEDIETAEVIVEGKGEICKDPQGLPVAGLDEMIEPLEREGLKVGARIQDNVWNVVELKGDVEGVGVGHEGEGCHEGDRKGMLDGERTG